MTTIDFITDLFCRIDDRMQTPGLTHENSGNHMNQRLISYQLAFQLS